MARLSDMTVIKLITLKLTSPLFFPLTSHYLHFILEEFIIIMHNLRSGSMFFLLNSVYNYCTVNVEASLLNYA